MAADERKEDTTNSDAQTAYDITSFATPKLKFTEEYSTDKGTPTQIKESERLDLAKKILLYLFCFASVVIAGSASIIWLRSPCSGNGDSELVKLVYEILDLTKTVIPSMITLVLGFYFGRKDT